MKMCIQSVNGAIEQGIKELKKKMARALPNAAKLERGPGRPVRGGGSRPTQLPAPPLPGGANARDSYNQKQRRGRWNQRQRHLAFEWISCRAKAILQNRMKSDQRSVNAAWRHAVEAWLSDQALVEVH
ncbi:MAG TPA: hypothetical protein VL981_06525 [Candidatus Methylacidiphilales bacterium]|nr:hypothetical protein [Candidatus Methylacidiphilales bacterium]